MVMKMRKRLRKSVDKKIFKNTANRVLSSQVTIGQRGGKRI